MGEAGGFGAEEARPWLSAMDVAEPCVGEYALKTIPWQVPLMAITPSCAYESTRVRLMKKAT